jgi:hypothetical protein
MAAEGMVAEGMVAEGMAAEGALSGIGSSGEKGRSRLARTAATVHMPLPGGAPGTRLTRPGSVGAGSIVGPAPPFPAICF